jgi:hypothetical protein
MDYCDGYRYVHANMILEKDKYKIEAEAEIEVDHMYCRKMIEL